MAELIPGIDVSRWQGVISWPDVAADGIRFAFIKSGGSDAGFYMDPYFKENVRGAAAAGLRVGVYYYVGPNCTSYADGEADGLRLIVMLSEFRDLITLPAVIDFEAPGAANKDGNTAAVRGFCKAVSDAGFIPMIYASEIAGFRDRLKSFMLPDIRKWVAKWSSTAPATMEWDVWQQTSEGKVNGISGPVDLDFFNADAWEDITGYSDKSEFTKALEALKGAIEELERYL